MRQPFDPPCSPMNATALDADRANNSQLTDDALFAGRLICRQPRHGYRFSVDAVLAAHFAVPKPGSRVLDLGCGCGVIGLILAHRHPTLRVIGLEMQEALAAAAEDNIITNGFADRCRVIRGDLRAIQTLMRPESVDLVVCNPPYQKQGVGRVNMDDQAALARHELHGDIADFVRAAAFCLANRGRAVFVYPARRTITLLAALDANNLAVKRLQLVYSYPGVDESARLVLVEAVKNGGEDVELMAPWYIYERKNGEYTAAMRRLYEG